MENTEFENEVRKIARALWPSAENQGKALIDGQERDGVFITDECVHLIEFTTSRGQDKALEDINKLVNLADKMRGKYLTKAIKCWFITLYEPTEHQREIVKKANLKKNFELVVSQSLDQFRSKLINASSYIECRKNYRFGSMDENAQQLRSFSFVELDIFSLDGVKYGIHDLISEILDGGKFVFLGDYGAGKSTTMRELFINLQSKFLQSKITKFPILLNLRDHFGQTNPAEALERHARNIGYDSPSHLVKAWRAGYAVILLDGFDEVAIPGWSGHASKLQKLRFDSMELVREFIKGTPSNCGVAISGRSNFFNSIAEMQRALGVDKSYKILNLSDFTEEQIKQYLEKKGLQESIPSWMPSRPLLLGYLASKGLLQETVTIDSDSSPAAGWDMLLTRICEREAKIELGVDGPTIRVLIERLASKARKDFDGLGPLQQHEILKIFQDVCGFPPDDRSIVLIQKLPGLGMPRSDDGSRSFIDSSLADTAKAGDVFRYLQDPHNFDFDIVDEWQSTLRELGVQVAAQKCLSAKFTESKIVIAIEYAINKHSSYALGADIVQVAQEMNCGSGSNHVYIKSVFHPELTIGETDKDFSNIEYQECVFQTVQILPDTKDDLLPKFDKCTFGTVEGRVSERDLPKNVFINCTYENFSETTQTSNAILSLQLPLGVRVMLVTLKKLYLQAGSGRKESSFYRGLDQRARSLVPPILQLLRREGLVREVPSGGRSLWLPLRSQSARVRRILSAPTSTDDSLLSLSSRIE